MPRVPRMPKRPDPCPPHEWKDVSPEGWYLLRCAKCGEEYPP